MDNLTKHFKYFNEFDEDIQNLILSKIRKPQDKNLLNDIIDYKKSKELLFNRYEYNGYTYDSNDDMFYIYYQIDNDLIGYYNDYIALDKWVTIENIKKLERILSIKYKFIKNKDKTLKNILFSNNLSTNSRINILLGGLTIAERKSFISTVVLY